MVCKKCGVGLPPEAVFCFACGVRQEPVRQKRRRGNGEGTVYKRGASWCCERTFGYTPTGRVMAKKAGFKTKREALEYLPKLQDPRILKPTRRKSTQIPLKELYDLWLPTHQASPKTLEGYRAAFSVFKPIWQNRMETVSYTHLDVYKRQDVVDVALFATGIVTVTLDTPLMILLLSPVRSVLEAEKSKAENMGAALDGTTRMVP